MSRSDVPIAFAAGPISQAGTMILGTALVLAGIGVAGLRYDASVRRAARGRMA